MDEPLVWMDELEQQVCWQLLGRAVVGRIGFLDDGHLRVLPVNYVVDGESIVIRTDHDSSLASVARGGDVTFQADAADGMAQTGWSVVVEGVAERAAPGSAATSGPWLHPWAPGPKDQWVRIVPRTVSGRAISRQRRLTDDTRLPYMPPD